MLTHNYTYVIGEGINIYMLQITSNQTQLSTLLDSYFISNMLTDPRRIISNSATLLDAFPTNLPQDSLRAGTFAVYMSDHLPIYLITDKQNGLGHKTTPSTFSQDIDAGTSCQFKNETSNADWYNALSSFYAVKAYNSFIPFKRE